MIAIRSGQRRHVIAPWQTGRRAHKQASDLEVHNLERVTGINPHYQLGIRRERPLSAFPCYSCTSRPRTYLVGAPESSPVQPVCETNVRGDPVSYPVGCLFGQVAGPRCEMGPPQTQLARAMYERVVSCRRGDSTNLLVRGTTA